MTAFARSLFSASPFLRWTLGTVALAGAVGFPIMFKDARGLAWGVLLALETLLILLLVAMIAPTRCAWAGRVLTGIVFLAYVAYFVNAVWTDPAGLNPTSNRGVSSAFNALLGLIVIGLPSLKYALSGCLIRAASNADSEKFKERPTE
ncbi:MAG: hypothetical protein JNL28_10855 [Planctomycetes bacterium]|nr:hypothetical protein [Planctomycetota bacterium]